MKPRASSAAAVQDAALPPTPNARTSSPFQARASALLASFAARLERHSSIPILLLALVYFPAVVWASHAKPLWHDEIFTSYIAQSPSLPAMFHAIRSVDLNPPLSYLLTRLSFRFFGVNTLSCRLPEIVAFFIALLALCAFVRRRTGSVLYGVMAASVLFASLAGELALNARPYALLLCFVCLSLVGWQRARSLGPERTSGIVLVLLAGSGMLLSHIFGLFAWLALAAAELLRTWQRRRPDFTLWAAWILPLALVVTYLPMLRSHGVSAFPPAFQAGPEDIFVFYISHVDRELITLWLTALAVLVLCGKACLRGGGGWGLDRVEWTATAGLIAAPGLLITILMLTHGAYFPRYGIIGSIGIAILATMLLHGWTNANRTAAMLAALIALLISGQVSSAAGGVFHLSAAQPFRSAEPLLEPCTACAATATLDPALPLVDASGLTFMEMNYRESASTLSRVFYLTDPVASLQYAHASIFEAMPTVARLFALRGRVADYHAFTATNSHFFVLGQYDYPEDWLLRKLQADGAQILVRGRMPGQYKDHELYEITF